MTAFASNPPHPDEPGDPDRPGAIGDPAASRLPPTSAARTHGDWSLARRVAFRFVFLYLLFYSLPGPLRLLPYADRLLPHWHRFIDETLWGPVVRWAAPNIFHLTPVTPYSNLAGGWGLLDIACLGVLAAVLAAIWSAIDRRRAGHPGLESWFKVYLRFTAGAVLIDYGIEKVLLHQMGHPPVPSELFKPTALLPPQRLVWVYMGTSASYQAFAGAVEAVAGVLLMVRRTSMLGALIGTAALLNVVVIDWSYDIFVDLFATNVLIMAIWLVASDARRLTDFFILGRTGTDHSRRTLFANRWLDRIAALAGFAFLLWIVRVTWVGYAKDNSLERPALYGAYEVESFRRNGVEVAPLATDPTRWRRIFVNGRWDPTVEGWGEIQFMQDSTRLFIFRRDTANRVLALMSPRDPSREWRLYYAEPDSNHLLLSGPDDPASLLYFASAPTTRGQAGDTTPASEPSEPADSLSISLRRIDYSGLPLFRRRRWFR